MFEEIPENRPSEASAAWLLQISRRRPGRVGRIAGVRRTNSRRILGEEHPTIIPFSDGQSPNQRTTHRSRRLPTRLAAWIFRVGEKLARWKLAFTDYPLDGGN